MIEGRCNTIKKRLMQDRRRLKKVCVPLSQWEMLP